MHVSSAANNTLYSIKKARVMRAFSLCICFIANIPYGAVQCLNPNNITLFETKYYHYFLGRQRSFLRAFGVSKCL